MELCIEYTARAERVGPRTIESFGQFYYGERAAKKLWMRPVPATVTIVGSSPLDRMGTSFVRDAGSSRRQLPRFHLLAVAGQYAGRFRHSLGGTSATAPVC